MYSPALAPPWASRQNAPPGWSDLGSFGFSVSLDGDTALIGQIGIMTAGSHSWWRRLPTSTTPGQSSKASASDGATTDYFGFSVSSCWGHAFIGATNDMTTESILDLYTRSRKLV
jgi:hypothetical protein